MRTAAARSESPARPPSVPPGTRRCVEVDGVKLAYRDEGEGLPLVCLHAIAHDAEDFANLRARLATPVRLVALDWPGQGASGPDPTPASAARYAALARGFLEALDLRGVVLLGNSIGGAAALRVAAVAPDRVRALVLSNPGGLDRVDALARVVTGAFARFHAYGARGGRAYRGLFGVYYRSVLQRGAARARRAEIAAHAPARAAILAEAWRSFGRPEADQRALAPRVAQPVLFAWAARDPVVALRRAMPAIRRFPNARVERFAAGHSPFLETPDAFAASLDRFLGELGRG